MTRITVDADLLRQFKDARTSVEVCDEQGVAVGIFVPTSVPLGQVYEESPTSKEELERRKREGGHISTAELLRRLEAL